MLRERERERERESSLVTSFYNEEELKKIGFARVGKNVQVSRLARIYGACNIHLGNFVRIDDFSVLSGKIIVGNFVHIAPAVMLRGGLEGIELKDFAGIASRSAIYAGTDDYLGYALTNPCVDDAFRQMTYQKVILHKHVIIGTGSTILPGVEIGEGSSVGAMSLVNQSLAAWGVYAGNPCRKIKNRQKILLEKEKAFLATLK